MERNSILLILARLAQIVCGILVLAFAVAVKTNNGRYYHYNRHPVQFGTIFSGAAITLLGAIGLLFHKRTLGGGKSSMLIVFVDSLALLLCWGTGVVLTFQAVSFQWAGDRYIGPGGFLYAPLVIAYLCGFVVFALIVWNVFLKARPYHSSQNTSCDRHADLEPTYATYVSTGKAQSPHQSGDVKSSLSTKTDSVISGADTITHPNIGGSKTEKY